MTASERNKATVRRLVDEALNGRRLELIDELFDSKQAAVAGGWIEPFLTAFPDVHMEIVELVAEGDQVVARLLCSGTHRGKWRGQPPTGRRFERIDEVYFFTLCDWKIADAWGIEDTAARARQLGLAVDQPA